jgi:hypothetical protein
MDRSSRSFHSTLLLGALTIVPACADKSGDAETGASAEGSAGSEGGMDGSGADATGSSSASTSGTSDGTASSSGSGSSGTGSGSSGASESSSDSGSGTSGDEGTPFVVQPDGSGGNEECDIWAQDCADGQKCMPWANDGGNAWNATKCTPVEPNPKAVGDACMTSGSGVTGIDDCDVGAICWNTDEMGMGTCVPMCMGSAEAPSCENPDESCLITNEGVIILCLPICDPILQDCGERQGCYLVDGVTISCGPDSSGADGAYGFPCEYDNSCDPGLFCALGDAVPACTGGRGCCTEWCDLEAADPLAACTGRADGVECVPFFEPGTAPPDFGHVGMCVLPS